MPLTDDQLKQLAANLCDELAIPKDEQVLFVIVQALRQARDFRSER